jgi:hypothetical protein
MTMPDAKKLIRRAVTQPPPPPPKPVKAVAKKVPSGGGVARPNGVALPVKKTVAKRVEAEPKPVAGALKRVLRQGAAAAPPNKVAPRKVAPQRVVDDDEGEELSPEALRAGWSAAQETIDSTSTWAVTFKPTTQTQIVKFLQPSPYASFRRHWIRRVGGLRAYVCLQSFNRDCPLCDVGDRASAVSAFNIAVLGDDGEAVLKSWDCGVRITQSLKTFANDNKIGPLDKRTLYFGVMKTEGTGRQQASTLVSPVRERDLQEDYGLHALDDDDIERLLERAYTNDVVQMNSLKELQEVAEEIMNDDSASTSGQGQGWGSS